MESIAHSDRREKRWLRRPTVRIHEAGHMQSHPVRRVYLLTMWEERPARAGRSALWRFSLEDTIGGKRLAFGSLDALIGFLQAQMKKAGEKSPLEDFSHE